MKSRRHAPIQAMVFWLLSSVLTLNSFSQGTAFTYQGRLNTGNNPASGNYDLRFTILNANAGGEIFGGPVTNSINIPSNGIFTVTLDFGAEVFNGASRWLEIAVRTNGGGAFDTLFNRQAITPMLYAVQAVTAGNLTGVVVASGAGFTNLAGENVLGTVSDALHASIATNAPDGKPLVSNVSVTNIVNSVIAGRTDIAHIFNVRDYGAVGDGFTDDTAAIQAAINDASNVGATNFGLTKVVYFPLRNHTHSYDQTPVTRANTYRVDGTIYVSAAGITLRGEVQSDVTTLVTLFHTNASPCIVVGANGSPGGNMCQIEFLQIQGGGEFDYRNVGISFQRGAHFKIKNCLMYWIGVGISLTNTYYATIEDCSLNSCGRAVDLIGCDNTQILNTDMQEDNQGIQTDGKSLYVANCTIGGPTHDNGNMTNAIRVLSGGSIAQVTCVNTKFNVPGAKDGNVIGQFWTDQGGSFDFINCYFRNDYGGSNLCVVATAWPQPTYINMIGGRLFGVPAFGLTAPDLQTVFQQGDYSNPGVNAVLLTSGGAAYTGTTFATEYRVTRPMRIDGNLAVNGFPIVAQSPDSPTNNATLMPLTGYVKLSPSDAISLNSSIAIANGSAIGAILILEGSSDASTVTVPNAAHTRLSAAHTLGNRDTLVLLWNGSDWVELSYSNN